MSPMLKVKGNDEKKEFEFEIEYQLSLTAQRRFKMMFRKSREMLKMLVENGHRKPFEVIKRK